MSERCAQTLAGPIAAAYGLLPPAMRSRQADVMLLTIGLQESRLRYRTQLGGGPARGMWQFERGGVVGVLGHPATKAHALRLCAGRDVAPVARDVWAALEHDDTLAAGIARLNLWWLPAPLPALGDWGRAWEQYLDAWRPGKPKPDTWGGLYAEALGAVAEACE